MNFFTYQEIDRKRLSNPFSQASEFDAEVMDEVNFRKENDQNKFIDFSNLNFDDFLK